MIDLEAKLADLGYDIHEPVPPGPILEFVVVDELTAYVSAAIPINGGHLTHRGKVPSACSFEEAQEAARVCVVNNLRMLHARLGSLSCIKRVLRLIGYINSDTDFKQQHLVMNAGAQLLVDLFGESGLAARTAIGVAQLPLGATMETEMVVKLYEESAG